MQGVQEVVPDLFRGQYAYETTCQVRCVELLEVWVLSTRHWEAATAAMHVNMPGACAWGILLQRLQCCCERQPCRGWSLVHAAVHACQCANRDVATP